MSIKHNHGFGGRVFLLEHEWLTYMRRMPVRYIRRKYSDTCAICGKPAEADNPLEHSHIIGFLVGVRDFGLTPEYLDSEANTVCAHKRICNAKAEKSQEDVSVFLAAAGHQPPEYLARHR